MRKLQPLIVPSDLVANAEARRRKARVMGMFCMAVLAIDLFALILLFTR